MARLGIFCRLVPQFLINHLTVRVGTRRKFPVADFTGVDRDLFRYAAAFARRAVTPRRDRDRGRLASPPNCLIRTSPAGNFARISSFPPIASMALRNVLTKMSEWLSILDTPRSEERRVGKE